MSSRYTSVFAVAATIVLAVAVVEATKPASIAGSWLVDTQHSDAQLITDGTTDYGKTKIDITLGFGRVMGGMKIDDADASRSTVDLHIYPATSMSEPIEEDGKFKSRWMANRANHTMLCFHSKNIVRMSDGRLQANGNLIVVRVDRNVEVPTVSESYSGPVYGPPIINRVSHEASLVFDTQTASLLKNGALEASASTRVFREDFPQLVKTLLNTYWPPLVQDENCRVPDANEAYAGSRCTGTFLQAPRLPEDPGTHIGEDYPGPQNFNAQVGERLNVLLHMRLTPGSGQAMPAGD